MNINKVKKTLDELFYVGFSAQSNVVVDKKLNAEGKPSVRASVPNFAEVEVPAVDEDGKPKLNKKKEPVMEKVLKRSGNASLSDVEIMKVSFANKSTFVLTLYKTKDDLIAEYVFHGPKPGPKRAGAINNLGAEIITAKDLDKALEKFYMFVLKSYLA